MDHYHSFMEKLEQEVTILFRNIDAILVSESDFFKLKELGYIGDELWKFKIEKVFKEIAILSPGRRAGILEDGTPYYCPKTKGILDEDGLTICKEKFDAKYLDFKSEVINKM